MQIGDNYVLMKVPDNYMSRKILINCIYREVPEKYIYVEVVDNCINCNYIEYKNGNSRQLRQIVSRKVLDKFIMHVDVLESRQLHQVQ